MNLGRNLAAVFVQGHVPVKRKLLMPLILKVPILACEQDRVLNEAAMHMPNVSKHVFVLAGQNS